MTRRRWATLFAVGAGAVIGLSTLPGLGATVPPGGAALTRVYDPVSGTTTFTVDAGQGSHAALSFVTCPGARVLDAGGPAAQVVEALDGTTITFPTEETGTYRVVLAGDTPGLGVGEAPSACGSPTLLVDPAVVERAGAEIGPSTRITTLH
jgi:hypothetical protein